MVGLFTQTFAVARNAFAESIRQPFYVVWLLAVGGLIVLAPFLAAYTFDDDEQFALIMMLSMIQLGSLVLAAVLPALVIRREIDNHTAITVVSKPLARPAFVVGKYLGVVGASLLVAWSWSLLLLLMDRHGVMSTASENFDWPVLVFGAVAVLVAVGTGLAASYSFNRPFGGVFAKTLAVTLLLAALAVALVGKGFAPQSPLTDLDLQLMAAVLALWLMLLILAAVAVAAGVRLPLVPTLIVVLVVAGLGFTNDYFFGGEDGALGLLYRVLPNFQFLFLGDALTQGNAITLGYLGQVAVYATLVVVALLSLAVVLFQTRPIN